MLKRSAPWKPSVPYYIANDGKPQLEIPGSAALKNTSDARVVVGMYHVAYNDRESERFPWIVYKKVPLVVKVPGGEITSGNGCEYIQVESHPQFRMALRHARRLNREDAIEAFKSAAHVPAAPANVTHTDSVDGAGPLGSPV